MLNALLNFTADLKNQSTLAYRGNSTFKVWLPIFLNIMNTKKSSFSFILKVFALSMILGVFHLKTKQPEQFAAAEDSLKILNIKTGNLDFTNGKKKVSQRTVYNAEQFTGN